MNPWLFLILSLNLSVTKRSISYVTAEVQETTHKDSVLRQPVGCQELLIRSTKSDSRFEREACKYYYQNLIPGYFGDDDAFPFSLPDYDTLLNININQKGIERRPHDPFAYMGSYENFKFPPSQYYYKIELDNPGPFSLYYDTSPVDIKDYAQIPYFEGQGQLILINHKLRYCYRIQGYYYYIGDENNSIYRFFTVVNDTINIYENGFLNMNTIDETYDPTKLIGQISISGEDLIIKNNIN